MSENADLDLLKSDGSFELEMQAAVAEYKAAESRGDADPSHLCVDVKIDPSESLGGHNAYYFNCDHFHGRTNYAACQTTIALSKKGDQNMRPECQLAIERGVCPAMKMRARELEAKQALFFVDRRTLVKDLEARLAKSQTSEDIRYGKSRVSSPGLKTIQASPDSIKSFESTLAERNTNTTKPSKSDDFNADLAGRNLLSEAIENLMGDKQ